MKKTLIPTAMIAIAVGILSFSSCKQSPTPTPEQALEEYDASQIQFIQLNADGTATTDTTVVHFDITGTPSPTLTQLQVNKSYKTIITMSLRGKDVNQEIIDDGTIHKFFFLPSQGNIFEYAYGDSDKNGRGIGLIGTTTIEGAGTTNINVVLRHGLDKSLPDAQAWNSATYEKAGGEDDLNVTFQLHTQ